MVNSFLNATVFFIVYNLIYHIVRSEQFEFFLVLHRNWRGIRNEEIDRGYWEWWRSAGGGGRRDRKWYGRDEKLLRREGNRTIWSITVIFCLCTFYKCHKAAIGCQWNCEQKTQQKKQLQLLRMTKTTAQNRKTIHWNDLIYMIMELEIIHLTTQFRC